MQARSQEELVSPSTPLCIIQKQLRGREPLRPKDFRAAHNGEN